MRTARPQLHHWLRGSPWGACCPLPDAPLLGVVPPPSRFLKTLPLPLLWKLLLLLQTWFAGTAWTQHRGHQHSTRALPLHGAPLQLLAVCVLSPAPLLLAVAEQLGTRPGPRGAGCVLLAALQQLPPLLLVCCF